MRNGLKRSTAIVCVMALMSNALPVFGAPLPVAKPSLARLAFQALSGTLTLFAKPIHPRVTVQAMNDRNYFSSRDIPTSREMEKLIALAAGQDIVHTLKSLLHTESAAWIYNAMVLLQSYRIWPEHADTAQAMLEQFFLRPAAVHTKNVTKPIYVHHNTVDQFPALIDIDGQYRILERTKKMGQTTIYMAFYPLFSDWYKNELETLTDHADPQIAIALWIKRHAHERGLGWLDGLLSIQLSRHLISPSLSDFYQTEKQWSSEIQKFLDDQANRIASAYDIRQNHKTLYLALRVWFKRWSISLNILASFLMFAVLGFYLVAALIFVFYAAANIFLLRVQATDDWDNHWAADGPYTKGRIKDIAIRLAKNDARRHSATADLVREIQTLNDIAANASEGIELAGLPELDASLARIEGSLQFLIRKSKQPHLFVPISETPHLSAFLTRIYALHPEWILNRQALLYTVFGGSFQLRASS